MEAIVEITDKNGVVHYIQEDSVLWNAVFSRKKIIIYRDDEGVIRSCIFEADEGTK